MMPDVNRQIHLVDIPADKLEVSHFELKTAEIPGPGEGEALCRTLVLSLDAANRTWMQGATYRDALEVGDVMAGAVLAEIVESNDPSVAPGDIVQADSGWQEYAALPASALKKIKVRGPLSHHLGALGLSGLTAYFGVLEVGRPAHGETLLVSAAAGAAGNLAGQIAAINGCRVVGITGTAAKCAFLTDELGFDAAVNYRSDKFRGELKAACPDGVDMYFDNTGGDILGAALFRMNQGGRIICCGAVSQYDTTTPGPGPRGIPGLVITKRLRMEGFIVFDFAERYDEALDEIVGWIAAGRLKVVEDVLDGLESAPAGLVGLLAGENIGKRVVRVGDPS